MSGVKTDCISYERIKGGCLSLDKTYCKVETCRFYKNRKMLHEQVQRIRERLPDYKPFPDYGKEDK